MKHRRMLIAAAGTAILLIAGIAAYAVSGSGPLSRSEMRLADGFAAAFTRCMDIRPDGSHLVACQEAEILKKQTEEAGLCLDFANTRKDTYQDFYHCGSPR